MKILFIYHLVPNYVYIIHVIIKWINQCTVRRIPFLTVYYISSLVPSLQNLLLEYIIFFTPSNWIRFGKRKVLNHFYIYIYKLNFTVYFHLRSKMFQCITNPAVLNIMPIITYRTHLKLIHTQVARNSNYIEEIVFFLGKYLTDKFYL